MGKKRLTLRLQFQKVLRNRYQATCNFSGKDMPIASPFSIVVSIPNHENPAPTLSAA
jgi:hypothetical protein